MLTLEIIFWLEPAGPVYWKLLPTRSLSHVVAVADATAIASSDVEVHVGDAPADNTKAPLLMLYATKNASPFNSRIGTPSHVVLRTV
jgi:hypothetical protein